MIRAKAKASRASKPAGDQKPGAHRKDSTASEEPAHLNGDAANGQTHAEEAPADHAADEPMEDAQHSGGSRRRQRATAHSMAKAQRDISVSEFFAKNRHLLGFDNPRKALLTAVKEAVDNSLDACEEAGILPELWVHIEQTGENRYKIGVQDNGPGI
ncbi:MAG TPA: hypothetical protein VFE46_10065, partial [Pirellulales bacterium]|nr:hypothetical protein [Pirellulales bacterium]